ncbi:MAG: hypothetical protein EPN97_18610 [Alphaproteobacteria bacterium]|nr:MAG: hypothetical protein EPN97_18610 [Alphaproteobacteria bacterium]
MSGNSLFLKNDNEELGIKKNDKEETVITFRLAQQYTVPGHGGTCKKTMTEKELAKALDAVEKIGSSRSRMNACAVIQAFQLREALEKLQTYKLEHGAALETPSVLDKKKAEPGHDKIPGIEPPPVKLPTRPQRPGLY